MAQTLRLLLAEEEDIRHVGHGADDARVLLLAVAHKALFKVGGVVKVILDRGFAAVCDYEDLLNAGGHGLLHDVLDDGLIHERQHLLGGAFGVGQQTRAQPCGGDNGFPDFH